jgi:hypothetical protein
MVGAMSRFSRVFVVCDDFPTIKSLIPQGECKGTHHAHHLHMGDEVEREIYADANGITFAVLARRVDGNRP